ncbi:helix-turn-helix domain-containing protein [Sphingopyxis macrogoltabida]|uniref:helix-turn-helix domain-containing protein n=1 Tax=Sphingopyxis macrogoltabida TaxID=33050 RepID=UPI0006CA72AA|nr:XRE family transcriptional regulator [Sphingopyxis macrogoltabida]
MREKTGQKSALASSRLKVGAAVREKRVAAGLSLAQLAEQIGVALSTMSKIENGKLSTSFERLDSICRALDADLAEFLGSEGMAVAPPSPLSFGMRRSVTLPDEGTLIDAGGYLEWFLAADLLNKRFQPIIAEILLDDIANYGPFTSHSGEEFNYVLEGEVEFHTEIYAPVRLAAGASIYFDAEMKHAHIRIGKGRCRILAILCPRAEAAASAGRDYNSLHVVGANTDDVGSSPDALPMRKAS